MSVGEIRTRIERIVATQKRKFLCLLSKMGAGPEAANLTLQVVHWWGAGHFFKWESLFSSPAANPISLAKLMINIKPLDAVTFVLFNDPRLKFLTFCRTIKLPFCFHLLGETFDFFSCLYYTSSSGVIEVYILLSLMIRAAYSIIREHDKGLCFSGNKWYIK